MKVKAISIEYNNTVKYHQVVLPVDVLAEYSVDELVARYMPTEGDTPITKVTTIFDTGVPTLCDKLTPGEVADFALSELQGNLKKVTNRETKLKITLRRVRDMRDDLVQACHMFANGKPLDALALYTKVLDRMRVDNA